MHLVQTTFLPHSKVNMFIVRFVCLLLIIYEKGFSGINLSAKVHFAAFSPTEDCSQRVGDI